MEPPYEVSVSVPDDYELTEAERSELKERFKAQVVETLAAKVGFDIDVEIVGGGGGGSGSA